LCNRKNLFISLGNLDSGSVTLDNLCFEHQIQLSVCVTFKATGKSKIKLQRYYEM